MVCNINKVKLSFSIHINIIYGGVYLNLQSYAKNKSRTKGESI